MTSLKLLALLVTVGLTAASTGAGLGSASAATSAPAFRVTGYVENSTTAGQLAASTAVTDVSVDGINLTDFGGAITKPSNAALAQLAAAHADGRTAELLLGNFDESIGDFSPAMATRMLRSPAKRTAIVTALVAEVKRHGWDGVTVDLESLSSKHRAGLTAFMAQLDAALGSTKTISICLMATTTDYSALGYDLKALAKSADSLVLMAYDQHGPWSEAGAVGGLSWVKKTLSPLIAAVPDERIQLGIAGYGYDWPADGGEGRQYSAAAARALVEEDGATAVWSIGKSEWHATLDDGTVIWWSDAKSYAARVALAKRLSLGGVAVWSLSLADPLT